MRRIPLLSGAYSARSIIANAQRCVNLYPETNPQETDPPAPVTHYLTPGLTLRVGFGRPGTVRAVYTASNGQLFMVFEEFVYAISETYVPTLLGTISAGSTPVSLSDNGIVVVLVTGDLNDGWVWNIDGTGYKKIVDAAFLGATRVVYLDGFFVFNRPATNQFYISPNFWDGNTAFDGTQIASKTQTPNPIVTMSVILGNLWLIGELDSEIWYDAGNLDFPFARQPGVFVAHGCVAPYSVGETDVVSYWLGRDRQGQAVMFQGANYQGERISNHAVETEWQSYGDVSDAIAMNYQQGGHTFIVLQFPAAAKTWSYDFATKQWHERTSTYDGVESRHRSNCCAQAYGKIVVGDWEFAQLFTWDLDNGLDQLFPIVRRRGFPHLVKDGARLSYDAFIADMDVSVPWDSSVYLHWSDDRGKAFGTPVALPRNGTTLDSLILRRLGLARDRVFELYWSFPQQTALNGAWIEVTKAET